MLFSRGILAPAIQDMGTSTATIKAEDSEGFSVPVHNITFNIAPVCNKDRKRKVLVIKYLKSRCDEEESSMKSMQSSNRSTIKFLNLGKQEDTCGKANGGKHRYAQSRPNTGNANGPITKRALSEIYFDGSAGTRLFDISEVLSVAHGEINVKKLRFSRELWKRNRNRTGSAGA